LHSSKKILIFDFSVEITLFCCIVPSMPDFLRNNYILLKKTTYEKAQF